MLRVISTIIVHALFLSNVAWAVPSTTVYSLAPPTIFNPIVKRVNGIKIAFEVKPDKTNEQRLIDFGNDIHKQA